MSAIIRRARHADAQGITKVHSESIKKICSRDYTSEQIAAWAGRKFKDSVWHQVMDRDFVWVIESDGEILGFGHFAVMDKVNGEIMGLYMSPDSVGQGFAKKMIDQFIAVAKKHDLEKITLYSTITAKTFYEKIGFLQSAGDTSIEMQGVPIPCFPMELVI